MIRKYPPLLPVSLLFYFFLNKHPELVQLNPSWCDLLYRMVVESLGMFPEQAIGMKMILAQNYISLDTDITCMPTKTVVGRKKATLTKTKRTLTQVEIQASIDRLDADMERAGKGRKYTHAEIKKKYGL